MYRKSSLLHVNPTGLRSQQYFIFGTYRNTGFGILTDIFTATKAARMKWDLKT